MEEIEVKFLNIDKPAVEAQLLALSANKVGDYEYRWRTFDYPDWRLDKQAAWLRLRDEGNKITLAFKQRLGVNTHDGSANDTGMEEIEVIVSDFADTSSLLLKLGFVEKHYAEKRRTRYEKDGIEFDIDTLPEIEPYLEIEAPAWEQIDQAMEWLKLNPADKKIFSANQIYAQKGIVVADYIRLAFDGIVKRDQ